MAGVACPMMRSSRAEGTRFLVGLGAGTLLGGVMLAAVAYSISLVAQSAMSHIVRIYLLAILCVALGLADLTNNTPHTWRQVPQALIRHLPPGRVGLVWGIDIGLVATTQKVTSLLWAALAAFVLLYQQGILAFGLTVGFFFSLSVASRTWLPQGEKFKLLERWRNKWLTWVRVTSGLVLLMGPLVVR